MTEGRGAPYVLVVEDHPLVADFLVASVQDCAAALEVCVVPSLRGAVDLIQVRAAPLLILTDLSLLDAQGMAVVQGLRGAAQGCPLLVITGVDDPGLRRQAAECGAIGYIVKGSGTGTIRGEIAAALRECATAKGIAMQKPGRIEDLLTRAQIAVVVELASGRSNKEIALRLNISDETVGSHMREILGRLGARNRTEAVLRYLHLTSRQTGMARG